MEDGGQTRLKMSGYLSIKNKKRMIAAWKTYWFVLEDRLLLFYRSKDEYQAISPCKGSINLAPPCIVKLLPSTPHAFQIETRTNTYNLRAQNSEEHIRWMQTIMLVLNQNQNFAVRDSQTRLSHFRYSLDNLIPEKEPHDIEMNPTVSVGRRKSMSHKKSSEAQNSTEIIQRLQKMGAHSYGGNLLAITKITKRSVSNDDNNSPIEATVVPNNILREEPFPDNIYEQISSEFNTGEDSNRVSFIVDNENYSIPVRKSQRAVEDITPKREVETLLLDNEHYISLQNSQSNEVIYSEPELRKTETIDVNKNSVIRENSFYTSVESRSTVSNENVYEDLDEFQIGTTPPAQSLSKNVNKSADEKSSVEKTKLKKSRSFIMAWKRRSKKKAKKNMIENVAVYEEIPPQPDLHDGNTVQMLSELQNILEHKKSKLKTAVSKIKNSENDQLYAEPDISHQPPTTEYPNLPIKFSKKPATFYDTTTSTDHEEFRSLDEILEELDKEQRESKNKVKMLIEKFSEHSDEVILRKRNVPEFKIGRHSEDLNKLLDELAKVTSAPIMAPRATHSLNMNKDEWLKLVPVRRRRLSEPDYDIPRSHKSITLPVKIENSDAIPVTRFLGPVLATGISESSSPYNDSLTPSMTPDSLEIDLGTKINNSTSYKSHYMSTNFDDIQNMKLQPEFQHNDTVIYALPKSYVSVSTHIVTTCDNLYGNQVSDDYIIYKNVKNIDLPEEIFKDSLETTN